MLIISDNLRELQWFNLLSQTPFLLQIKGMSLKTVGVQQKRGVRSRKREKNITVVKEGESLEEKEWVAEAEPGVLVTLVALSDGGNYLKKIRFSEEIFDTWEAQRWWSDNCDKIMELYSIHQDNFPLAPIQSDDECLVDSSQVKEYDESSGLNLHIKAMTGESSTTSTCGTENEVGETVVEDQPGIFVAFRTTPNGSKELLRVELSREMFGEVKARVWWEENKIRLQKQYS